MDNVASGLRRRVAAGDALVALATGAAAVAGSYAVAGFTPAFVGAPVEGALARGMPGAVVTFAITVLGSLGQQLNLLTALALACALLGVASNASAARTLKIATSVPAGTAFIEELKKASDTIAKRTDGRVELKLYPGGVMGSDQAVLRKIRIGQLHGAVITANALAKIHPDAQVYSLPFIFRNREEVEYVRERIDPVIRERVRSEGFVVTGISEGGFTYLFTKEPIDSVDTLGKARVWVPQGDEITARMFQSADSQTVSLPVSDVYTSLQTGMIDTVAINPSGAIALQWHTGVNHYTNAPLLFLVGMMVVDERAMKALDDGDREIVQAELEDTFNRLDEINADNNREALEALRARGITPIEPARPPDEREWEAIARETLQAIEAEGRFDSALLERVRGLVSEYRARNDD
ncbi:MAG: TRAP transporter substrate-binding protein DctP [Haloferacaceae archaeon]